MLELVSTKKGKERLAYNGETENVETTPAEETMARRRGKMKEEERERGW